LRLHYMKWPPDINDNFKGAETIVLMRVVLC